MNTVTAIVKKYRYVLLVGALVLVSACAHGANMFSYPYYENDEGAYMSQAWSLVETGALAPYTYWYDHAPVGWFFIALWTQLTGGFFTFDISINTGRVFMLVLHVISTILLYYIARRLGGSRIAASIALLLFALSPLGLFYHRRVLLDNIMTFWTLASIALVLIPHLKLRHIFFSGLFFGIAVLTKENAVLYGPLFMFLLFFRAAKAHRLLAYATWLIPGGITVSLYFLYALLKGELFPEGLWGDATEHVSLLETLQFQGSRKASGSILEFSTSSDFWLRTLEWVQFDALLIVGGTVGLGVLFVLAIIRRNYKYFAIVLWGLINWGFLARGGIVLEFYIIPLIPLLALAVGFTLAELVRIATRCMPHKHITTPITVLVLFVALVGVFVFENSTAPRGNPFFNNQTAAQIEALDWIRENVSEDDVIIIDNYAFVDLNAPTNPSGKVFPHAEWYWKVDFDDDIKLDLLNNDINTIDVIAVTPQIKHDVTNGNFFLFGAALAASRPILYFADDGWSVDLWFPLTPESVLKRSWRSYKKNYIYGTGMVYEPHRPHTTTSEAQSYALLRAVMLDDRETFDRVYAWTVAHLRLSQGLFGWKYEKTPDMEVAALEAGTATDADQDIALALLFASARWGDDTYRAAARDVLHALWEQEVAYYGTTPYLTAGNWAANSQTITLNPSYLSPAHYRIFAEADPDHPWDMLVASSYRALERCTDAPLQSSHGVLPPEWCALNKTTGGFEASRAPQPTDTIYGFNAFRVPWHIALDAEWFDAPEARAYLRKMFVLQDEWSRNARITATYTHSGAVWDNYESVAAYGGNIGLFHVLDPATAQTIYHEKILSKFYENKNESYWDDPDNYYTQNWGWFGTALVTNNFPNLWERYTEHELDPSPPAQ